MKKRNFYLFATVCFLLFTSCNNDDQNTEMAKATLTNIEIGLNNDGRGIIGRDFHLNAEIVAGGKIDQIIVDMLPMEDQGWSFQIVWDEYKGLRNTTVHKHFTIPEDAVEGIYDFIITVTDENGSITEEKRTINLFLPENLPVDPELSILTLFLNNDFFYREGEFMENAAAFHVNDTLLSQVTIDGVKGDGKMYLLLINKDLNHRPETIDAIDFSKTIVYDYYEHENWLEADSFSNFVFDIETFTTTREIPQLVIGTEKDNLPEPSLIDGEKQWKTGTYYYGVLYENTTYNVSLFQYIEVEVTID